MLLFKNLKIDSIRALTEGKHLKLTVKENKSDKLIIELKEKINLLEDKNKRTQAEFINYRNRTENEISNMFKYDGEKVIKGGIVYKNEFICGCCGEVFSLKSKHCIKRLYVYNDWVNVSDQIAGASADDLKIETE